MLIPVCEGGVGDCGEDIPPQMPPEELLMSITKLVAVSWLSIYYSDLLELDNRCAWNMKVFRGYKCGPTDINAQNK